MLRSRPGNTKVILIIVLVVVGMMFLSCTGVVAALLLPAIGQARLAAQRQQSINNTKQIMLALHNYHDTYLRFPAAYVPDENGKPMHSWRVAILPFVEQNNMFDQYDFGQPWDSPHNLEVTKRMPGVYASPALSSQQIEEGLTTYKAIAGPGTGLSTTGWNTFSGLPNGASGTIVIIEDTQNPVHWSEPDDISPEEFLQLNFDDGYFQGTVVGMGDGACRVLTEADKGAVQQMVKTGEQ
ncbi:DUF1559 domain-containing protein [bacterium]|nr:DUF1559 domain-containing protein [bacterium]